MTKDNDILKPEDALASIAASMAHDAKAAALITQLQDHFEKTGKIGKRIETAVANKYDFTTTEIDARPITTFTQFLEATIAQVGLVSEMAKAATLKDDERAYIQARLSEAQEGHCDPEASRIKVLSRLEVHQRVVAASYEPVVELAQRVLNIDTPSTRFRPDQIERIIGIKSAALDRAQKVIDAYDMEAEKDYLADIEAKMTVERERLKRHREEGYVDPQVEVSPVFAHYEDQILLNIHQLDGRLRSGSPDRIGYLNASNEAEVLRDEIAALRISLVPIKEKAPAIPSLSEKAISETIASMNPELKPEEERPIHFPKISREDQLAAEHDQMKRFIEAVGRPNGEES
jgi:hypothetical protein